MTSSKPSKADLILPVWNRIDALRSLLRSLEAHTNRDLLGQVFIGDDAGDSFSARALHDLIQAIDLPIVVVRQPENLGFGENCNRLLAKCGSPYCIILNSDVVVPPRFLERMLAPFAADNTVALATPLSTNAANLTVRLRPGQHWREADELLSDMNPRYPDACTAVGFCMAVDREKLEAARMPLFDPIFGRGYGEDSDLHYRMTLLRHRSVVVDNLLVFHGGGASFSLVSDADKIRDQGMHAFRTRWDGIHRRAVTAYNKAKPLSHIMDMETHVLRRNRTGRVLDVLIVLSSTEQRFGGVSVLSKFTGYLLREGLDVGVVIANPETAVGGTDQYGFEVFQTVEDMKRSVASACVVLATSRTTFGLAESLATQFSAPLALFLQGPELMFDSGRTAPSTFAFYNKIRHILPVSEYLAEYARTMQPGISAESIKLGPDPLLFYPRDIPRVPKSIAVPLRAAPTKGTGAAMQAALLLKQSGYSLTFFGWDAPSFNIPSDLGDIFPGTSQAALAELFSRSEFILDCSFFEGLGLLPLEAAFCGCIPILTPKGGSDQIFTHLKDSFLMPDATRPGPSVEEIAALGANDIERMKEGALALRGLFSEDDAFARAKNILTSSHRRARISAPLR